MSRDGREPAKATGVSSGQTPQLIKWNEMTASGNGQVSKDKKNSPAIESELLQRIQNDRSLALTISMLEQAIVYAHDCHRATWDFAVEMSDMQSAGVSTDKIRWLVGKGIVEHALEVTPPGNTGRAFEAIGSFTFSQRSCFVLTPYGLKVALELNEQMSSDDGLVPGINRTPDSRRLANSDSPLWDAARHELRVGEIVVKRFKGRAANQEAVLNAFQEENWPARIDDPLIPLPEIDAKRRLSDTIKCLNRKHVHSLIRFSGDGTGEGIIWTRVDRK